MVDEEDPEADIPETGQIYHDSMYDTDVLIKYADDEVILVQEQEDGYHAIYTPKRFNMARESFMQPQNRFSLQNDS